MIILGIDPGTKRIGYGIVEKNGNNLKLVDAGLLELEDKNNHAGIKHAIDRLIQKHKPDCAGIERLYFSKNQKTALQVAEARGLMILSFNEHGVPYHEFSPNEVKANIVGYGHADKKAVLKMVRLILKEPRLDVIDDASDALAIAIMASARNLGD